MKKILLLSSLIIVTACANMHVNQTHKQLTGLVNAETKGWEKVFKLTVTNCPNGTEEEPLPRSKAIVRHNCWSKLINDHVYPVAMAPDLLREYVIDNKRVAISYKKGEVDRDDANLEMEELWSKYVTEVDNRSKLALQNAHQKDLVFQQNLQNFSRELRQEELERYKADAQAFSNSRTRRIACYSAYNNTDCILE